MMDPHSLRPPARRRRGREGDQAVLEAGDAGSSARALSEVPTAGVGGGNDSVRIVAQEGGVELGLFQISN